MGFKRLEEWLRVLIVNDVMFSYHSFFFEESSRKKKGLSASYGASLSI
jgi:hypothetical protein